MIGVPIKKKEHFGLGPTQRGECRVKTQTWREDGRENQRRNWSDAAPCQGRPEAPRSWKRPGEILPQRL